MIRSASVSFWKAIINLQMMRSLLLSTTKYGPHPISDAVSTAYEQESVMVSLLYRALYEAVSRHALRNPKKKAPRRHSLEVLERAFLALSRDAEAAEAAARKLARTGDRRARNSRKVAERMSRITREAARNLISDTYGLPREGVKVLHSYDNPLCVRPSHLFLGTQGDNIRDASRKGRHGSQRHPELRRGRNNGMSVLDANAVQQIRRLRARGMSATAIGKRFKVTKSCISCVVLRKTWKHIP